MGRQVNPRGEMPFLDHLEELRWRIFKSAGALFAGTLIGFLLVHYLHVTQILVRPVEPYLSDGKLAVLSPMEPFLLEVKLAIIVGLLLSFPIIAFQIWAFFAPALEKHERRVIIPSLYLGLLLFAAGVTMAYVLLPWSLRILLTQFASDYVFNLLGAGIYLGFVVRFLLGFGLIFELPVVIMLLTVFGLVTPAFLREKRRYAIVGITILAAFVSPGDVVFLTVLMMAPLMLLYEFSIFLSALVYRRRNEDQDNHILADGPPEGAVELHP
jgi:sec-independent protein translocase protein TatC